VSNYKTLVDESINQSCGLKKGKNEVHRAKQSKESKKLCYAQMKDKSNNVKKSPNTKQIISNPKSNTKSHGLHSNVRNFPQSKSAVSMKRFNISDDGDEDDNTTVDSDLESLNLKGLNLQPREKRSIRKRYLEPKSILTNDGTFNGQNELCDEDVTSDNEVNEEENECSENDEPEKFVYDPVKELKNKEFDTKKFRQALTNRIPNKVCDCCNHLLCVNDMVKLPYDVDDPRFDLLKTEGRVKPLFQFGDGQPPNGIYLCKNCDLDLKPTNRYRKMPKYALANRLDFGELPNELKDLNLIEQRCIAPYNCITSIIRLKRGFGNQYGTIGGVAHVHNDVGKFYRILPVHPLDTQILNVFIGGKTDFTELPEGYNAFKLRPQRVKDALHWLKANNPLYSQIILDFDEMDKFVRDNENDTTLELDSNGRETACVQVNMKVMKILDSNNSGDDVITTASSNVSTRNDSSANEVIEFRCQII
jgi:uncharacterized protein YdcH (DUF465 family)